MDDRVFCTCEGPSLSFQMTREIPPLPLKRGALVVAYHPGACSSSTGLAASYVQSVSRARSCVESYPRPAAQHCRRADSCPRQWAHANGVCSTTCQPPCRESDSVAAALVEQTLCSTRKGPTRRAPPSTNHLDVNMELPAAAEIIM